MAEARWKIRGEYMESCNCDYLCPCVYTNPQGAATEDNCTALMAYRVDDGAMGEVRLDGLKFVMVIRSGRVMADGKWVYAGIVEESADAAQRRALAAIVAGEAGGTPQMIRDNLVSDFRGIVFKPIRFVLEGLKRSVAVDGLLDFAIEGVASRNRSGEPYYIDNTAHPANRRLALARAGATRLHGFGLDLELLGRGNNGHFAPFAWSG